MKDLKDINKAILSIKTSGAKLDKLIQETGVEVLEHFAEYKDTGLVNRLYQALPKGARLTAFTSWLLSHCAVVANTDKATKETQPFVYARDKVTKPEAAAVDMWYTHKPDKAPDQVFDLQAAVRAILNKVSHNTAGVKGGDSSTLKALAKAVGIPESDVPTLPVAKSEKALVVVGEAIV